ncbi:MAG: DsbA family protein [Peptostreptococcaceae bacterium]|nr:DsbA family protein [Peptostreptococcaceae bacterium]
MILIKCFTDPICTWCWGSEPLLRKLETHFPNQIRLEHIMGGLVDDIHGFMDEGNNIGGNSAAEFNRQVAAHWLEASAKHKMPVNSADFNLFSDEYPSTFPQNIAYKAAQLTDESKADLFLYNLRLASAAEARLSSHREVLLEIAAESKLNTEQFAEHLADGSAERNFEKDLQEAAAYGVSVFPTYVLEMDNRQISARGYVRFEQFVEMIAHLSDGKIRPQSVDFTEENLFALMKEHPRMAMEEIRQAFDFSNFAEVQKALEPFVQTGRIEIVQIGNGDFAVLK